jgi:hypothetical protein
VFVHHYLSLHGSLVACVKFKKFRKFVKKLEKFCLSLN